MSPAKLPLPDSSPAQPAKPPTPTMVVFVSELRRVVLQGRPVEQRAPAGVVVVSECGRVAFREWVAKPAGVVFVSECGRVASREWVVEPLASVGVALAGGLGVGCSGAGGGMSHELRQKHLCPLRIAEPPTPAMAAVIAELGLVAFQEQALEPPASAGTAFTGDYEPAPMVSVRKQVVA